MNQDRRDGFHIEEVAVDATQQKNGYGGTLLRFAETLARSGGFASIKLLAVEHAVPLYEKLGYKPLLDESKLSLPNSEGGMEVYTPMSRTILYHMKSDMDRTHGD